MSNTSLFRQKINSVVTTNNAKQISATKLRNVLIEGANAIDEISETLSLADGLGTFDASTGIAKIKETGVSYSLTSVANQSNGKYFNAVADGSVDIFGTGATLVKTGGIIISRGTKWDYIPPSDTGYSRISAINNQVDDLFETTTGVLLRNLPIPMANYRYTNTGVVIPGSAPTQLDFLDRTFGITGYNDAVNDGYTTFFDTGLGDILSYSKITFQAEVTAFISANPCVGIGFDYTGSGRAAYVYRKDGSLVEITIASTAVLRVANAGLAYLTGDDIKVEIVNTIGVLTLITSKNGVAAAPVTIARVPTGNLLIGMRGYLSVTTASIVSAKDSSILTENKSYTDAQVSLVDDRVDELQSDVNVITPSFVGKTTPVAGVNSGGPHTRISLIPIPVLQGDITISELKVFAGVAGTGRVKLLSTNGSFFTIQKTLDHVFTVGENILPGSLFSTWTGIQPGWFFAFESTGSMQFSNVVGAANSSKLVVGDVTAVAASLSSYELQYRADISATIKTKDLILDLSDEVQSATKSTFFISDSTGSDSNNGLSEAQPFKTISKGISKCIGKPFSTLILGGGTYFESLDESLIISETIRFSPKNKGVVIVDGSQRMTGWTKTAGRTNIYQCVFAGSIPAWSHPPGVLPNIFEHGNPSKQISGSEVHPYQKGLTHRLPYTEIPQITPEVDLAATLTELDATPGRHYLSGGVLYVHASNSSDISVSSFEYRIPVRPLNIVPSNASLAPRGVLMYENMRFMYGTSGLISSGFSRVVRLNCTFLGIVDSNGGARDDGTDVIAFKDEYGGCANDGANQHYDAYNGDYASQDVRRGVANAFYYDLWTHDNHDDGISGHPRSEVSVHGGLAEYNGDGGYVPANGAAFRLHNCLSRKNQQESDATQAGFGTANNAAGTGRNQTTMVCFNCVSIGDKVGFQNNSESGSVVELHNCVARESIDVNYKITTSGAIMNAHNCKSTHSNPAKHKSVVAGGVLNIYNDNALT